MNQSIAELFDSLEFDAAERQSSGREFEEVPDGKYLCEVLESDLRETKSSKEPMIYVKARIAEGKHAGRYLFVNTVINAKEGSLKTAKRVLSALGLPDVKFRDIAARLTKVNGKQVSITKQTKPSNNPEKPFVNYYFDPVGEKADDIDTGFDD